MFKMKGELKDEHDNLMTNSKVIYFSVNMNAASAAELHFQAANVAAGSCLRTTWVGKEYVIKCSLFTGVPFNTGQEVQRN